MGTIIRIQEQATKDDNFQAFVSFDSGPQYPIIVRNPFAEKQEKELEWYFEEHLEFPFTQKVRAKDAAANLTIYGETLFKQVFQENLDIYAEYKALLKKGLNDVRIEIAGSPRFHALHWEALKDPQLQQAKPLALQSIMLRQNLQPPPLQVSVQPAPSINLLIVTSRPYGVRDVSYRTISRPLVEALRQTDLRVNIDILRPGTYKTLENHLRIITGKHGTGYYHVIHFF